MNEDHSQPDTNSTRKSQTQSKKQKRKPRKTQNPKQSEPPSRVKEFINLNPNLLPVSKKKQSAYQPCQNHPGDESTYFNKFTKLPLCEECALKETLQSKKLNFTSKLSSKEFTKKKKSDDFLRRLQFYQVGLNGLLDRNERMLNESVQRHAHAVNRINVFFEHISSVFHEVYTKLVGDKTSRIDEMKIEHEKKKSILLDNIDSVNRFKADISRHYGNIIFEMELKPFDDIILEYSAKIDQIQEFCEKSQLDEYPVYKDIIENPKKIEEVNQTLQKCMNQLYGIFDNNLVKVPSKESLTSEKLLESAIIREDLSKINECFYSSALKGIKRDGKFGANFRG
jgi:hypothetical protein